MPVGLARYFCCAFQRYHFRASRRHSRLQYRSDACGGRNRRRHPFSKQQRVRGRRARRLRLLSCFGGWRDELSGVLMAGYFRKLLSRTGRGFSSRSSYVSVYGTNLSQSFYGTPIIIYRQYVIPSIPKKDGGPAEKGIASPGATIKSDTPPWTLSRSCGQHQRKGRKRRGSRKSKNRSMTQETTTK